MKKNTPPHSHSGPDHELENVSLREFEKKLGAGPDGLTGSEAQNRLEKYGYNELEEKETSAILKFFSYFWGPIPWMIEAAAILSALVRHWSDFAIIIALLIVNAVVGFWEEFQAGNTVAALKAKLALKARVRRDGTWASIPARELVPGDCIRLRLGDIIPADARLLDDDPVQVDESALTGESLPVSRKNGDTVYSGSVIKQGESDALVYATGRETYFGKTAGLVEATSKKSHFQQAILKIGDYLIVLAILLVVIILSVALFRGDDMATTLQFALVLTVAAIPVAMPTVLSVTMAVGARLLAAKEAIVTRLTSIEELAGIDILCSDKTGTLTRNELTLGDPFTVSGTDFDDVILAAALASRAEDQDTIDSAVIGGLESDQALQQYTIRHFMPFDPVQKRTEAEVEHSGHTFKVSKGAPQVIMALSSNADEIREAAKKTINDFAHRGFRSLGVARTDEQGTWQFLGILPLYDPPREDSHQTIDAAGGLGIDVKMVTGDQVAIGREISSQLGLGSNIMDSEVFNETGHHQGGQLADAIEQADGFAQVFPEHKYHIVDVLQNKGHIVGMTGDGVNDAPALKKADVGIAVSGATDAARAASDIVLMSKGLSVIIDAIRESRKIFQRMNSYAIYRITETIRVLLFMTLSILIFNFYPVTAVMIVMLALLNDGAILSIAYDNVRASDKPEAWNIPVVLWVATILGVMGVVETFGLFYLGEHVFNLNRDLIQTFIYLKLSISGHLTIFATRTRGPFWSTRPAGILMGAVIGTQCIATLIAVFGLFMTPIGWGWALLVWGYSLFWFLVEDRTKLFAYHILDESQTILFAKSHTRR